MLSSTILYIFVSFIVLVIFIEYINDRKSQNKRDEQRQKPTPKKPLEKELKTKEKAQAKAEKEAVEKAQAEAVARAKAEKEAAEKAQAEAAARAKAEKEAAEEVIEKVEEAKELPDCKYPTFTHVRLVEMGLSDDEAKEFVNELIPQLEEQVPLIEEAINNADFTQIERVTHGIKGSATNLGTGGIADLLVEFNTYLKSGTDMDIVKAYHVHFVHYIEELKKQYT